MAWEKIRGGKGVRHGILPIQNTFKSKACTNIPWILPLLELKEGLSFQGYFYSTFEPKGWGSTKELPEKVFYPLIFACYYSM